MPVTEPEPKNTDLDKAWVSVARQWQAKKWRAQLPLLAVSTLLLSSLIVTAILFSPYIGLFSQWLSVISKEHQDAIESEYDAAFLQHQQEYRGRYDHLFDLVNVYFCDENFLKSLARAFVTDEAIPKVMQLVLLATIKKAQECVSQVCYGLPDGFTFAIKENAIDALKKCGPDVANLIDAATMRAPKMKSLTVRFQTALFYMLGASNDMSLRKSLVRIDGADVVDGWTGFELVTQLYTNDGRINKLSATESLEKLIQALDTRIDDLEHIRNNGEFYGKKKLVRKVHTLVFERHYTKYAMMIALSLVSIGVCAYFFKQLWQQYKKRHNVVDDRIYVQDVKRDIEKKQRDIERYTKKQNQVNLLVGTGSALALSVMAAAWAFETKPLDLRYYPPMCAVMFLSASFLLYDFVMRRERQSLQQRVNKVSQPWLKSIQAAGLSNKITVNVVKPKFARQLDEVSVWLTMKSRSLYQAFLKVLKQQRLDPVDVLVDEDSSRYQICFDVNTRCDVASLQTVIALCKQDEKLEALCDQLKKHNDGQAIVYRCKIRGDEKIAVVMPKAQGYEPTVIHGVDMCENDLGFFTMYCSENVEVKLVNDEVVRCFSQRQAERDQFKSLALMRRERASKASAVFEDGERKHSVTNAALSDGVDEASRDVHISWPEGWCYDSREQQSDLGVNVAYPVLLPEGFLYTQFIVLSQKVIKQCEKIPQLLPVVLRSLQNAVVPKRFKLLSLETRSGHADAEVRILDKYFGKYRIYCEKRDTVDDQGQARTVFHAIGLHKH